MVDAPSDSKFLISYFDNYTKMSGLCVPFEDPAEEQALEYQSDLERKDMGLDADKMKLNQSMRLINRQIQKCNQSMQFLKAETEENFQILRDLDMLADSDDDENIAIKHIAAKVKQMLKVDEAELKQEAVGELQRSKFGTENNFTAKFKGKKIRAKDLQREDSRSLVHSRPTLENEADNNTLGGNDEEKNQFKTPSAQGSRESKLKESYVKYESKKEQQQISDPQEESKNENLESVANSSNSPMTKKSKILEKFNRTSTPLKRSYVGDSQELKEEQKASSGSGNKVTNDSRDAGGVMFYPD